jgi:hypothetical protein
VKVIISMNSQDCLSRSSHTDYEKASVNPDEGL